MDHFLFIETNTTGTGTKAMKMAKSKGYQIHFWTNDPGQYKQMAADYPLQLADHVKIVDTYDVRAMIDLVQTASCRFAGILAFDDYHLIPVSRMAHFLGLPGHPLEALTIARYKEKTRHFLQKNDTGFRQPAFHTIEDPSELSKDIPYPCVLKPVDDSGSCGVTICQNQGELMQALSKAMKRMRNKRGYKLIRKWLVEEFINGEEYSAEMLYTANGWELITATKKKTIGLHSVEAGHVTGKGIEPVPLLEEKCKKLLDLIGLGFGAAHIEFIVRENIPYLVEINPRLAGDCIPDLVELSTGIDMVEHVIDQAAGKRKSVTNSPRLSAAIQFAIPKLKGTYVKVSGIDEARKSDGVISVSVAALPMRADHVSSSYDRLGYVIAAGDTPDEASGRAEQAIQKLRWEVGNIEAAHLIGCE
ncbi:ATP-grasp domain-containing protein [Bacillus coagulans]|uniref:ATP-grasp domain-containing protein n=1 Tax=Heyndrickxia coagulans TaxID=1398 RepID=UPI0013770B79|nr:ATP-grasp domain-containing protein [Heyndrickxia coagulans]NCG68935.1 ATP-grasp domain-containing protein [Heyndrickxia coagulans]